MVSRYIKVCCNDSFQFAIFILQFSFGFFLVVMRLFL